MSHKCLQHTSSSPTTRSPSLLLLPLLLFLFPFLELQTWIQILAPEVVSLFFASSCEFSSFAQAVSILCAFGQQLFSHRWIATSNLLQLQGAAQSRRSVILLLPSMQEQCCGWGRRKRRRRICGSSESSSSSKNCDDELIVVNTQQQHFSRPS
jgi:hypothetical protein